LVIGLTNRDFVHALTRDHVYATVTSHIEMQFPTVQHPILQKEILWAAQIQNANRTYPCSREARYISRRLILVLLPPFPNGLSGKTSTLQQWNETPSRARVLPSIRQGF
jgi:hypothetical protein